LDKISIDLIDMRGLLKSVIMTNIICILLATSLILLSCACTKKQAPPISAETVLQVMLAADDHPSGRLLSLAAPDEGKQLTEPLLVALYGAAASKWYHSDEFRVIDSGGVYLSEVLHPFEIAVFRCVDQRDTTGGLTSVMGICSARLDMIKQSWQGSAYGTMVENALVTCCGNYVILIVAEDPEPMLRAARSIIKRQ